MKLREPASGWRVRVRALPVFVLVATLLVPPSLRAQTYPRAVPIDDRVGDYPPWVGQLTIFGSNVLLGALTGGIGQKIQGGSFRDGFTRGALGGAVVYAGKRVAVREFSGAGMLGRQIGAVGTSMVRNATDARPLLGRLLLPVGFVHVYVEPGADRPIRAELDVPNLAWTAWAVAEPELDFDATASLSGGAPVFRVKNKYIVGRDGPERASGMAAAGTILLSDLDDWSEARVRRTHAHERVHVLQDDFNFFAYGHAAENWLLDLIPGGATASRWIDLSISSGLYSLLAHVFTNYENRPWEMEAKFLEQRR